MRRALACWAVVVVAVGVSLFGGVAAVSGAKDVAHSTATPHVLSCAGKSLYEPSSLTIYCADDNGSLVKIHWTSWKSTKATATAQYRVNNCTPNCAAGKFHNYPATVKLTTPKSTSKYGELFSQLTVVYTQNHKAHSFNYPLLLKAL